MRVFCFVLSAPIIISLFVLVPSFHAVNAHDDPSCGTPNFGAKTMQRMVALKQRKKKTQNRIAAPVANITVDTYIWVVTDTFGNGDVPNSVLQTQMNVLNVNHANSNTGFNFQLKGVQRYRQASATSTFLHDYIDSLAAACHQGGMNVLNLYVVPNIYTETGKLTVGVAYPFFYTGANILDGVYVLRDALPGGSVQAVNLGMVAVHEVGHWLGLAHVFENRGVYVNDPCNPSNPQDYIADTPQMASPSTGCQVGRNSCPNLPGLDPINNFMDYSFDKDSLGRQCRTTFTPLQSARMQDVWYYYRMQNEICDATELQFELQLKFDSSPTTINWDVKATNGTVVHSSLNDQFGGPYGNGFRWVTITVNRCLPRQVYIFGIYDTAGNGIASPGYYQLSVNGQVIIRGGQDFKFSKAIQFGSVAPPSSAPSRNPTNKPTSSPTRKPTKQPTPPTNRPSPSPTRKPTKRPTVRPTASPTVRPTASPTVRLTASPTVRPTESPTAPPTASPTAPPTASPTAPPSTSPTAPPTASPTAPLTASPTVPPSTSPSARPTASPSASPSFPPTSTPTSAPTPASTTLPPSTHGPSPSPVAPPPTPAPATTETLAPSSGNRATNTSTAYIPIPEGYCFSAANSVEVESRGVVSIKELAIGDMVKDASGNMVRVYSFGHFHQTVTTEYLQIHAKGLSMPLEISKDHLVFVNGSAVPASLVSVGDELYMGVKATRVAQVYKINVVIRYGAYAPFTTSGTILVNGVAASSYVTLQVNSPVLALGGSSSVYKTSLSMHWLAHVFQSPRRLWCSLGMEFCQRETYNDDGIAEWVETPLQLSRWLVQQNGFVMVVVLVPILLPVLSCCAVEIVIGWFCHQTIATTMTVLLLLTAMLVRRSVRIIKVSKRKQI